MHERDILDIITTVEPSAVIAVENQWQLQKDQSTVKIHNKQYSMPSMRQATRASL